MQNNQDITTLIVEGIQEKKGHDIDVVDLSQHEMSAVGKFIICQGNSPTQVTAIADSVREYVQEHSGRKPYNYDGYRNAQWIVIDYGDAMVHIFLPDVRQHYNLEELWGDSPIEHIADIY